MIRRFLQSAARSFGRKYRYDVSYMLDTIDVSRSDGCAAIGFDLPFALWSRAA